MPPMLAAYKIYSNVEVIIVQDTECSGIITR